MIKIGLIGYGFMGRMHAECYAASGKGQVVALADVEADRRDDASAKWGCRTFASIGALLDGADVDAVDICTPTYLHEEHVLAAISAGKDVFCEKPLALTNESCERIVLAAKDAGIKLQVGHVVRFWPDLQVVKSVLDLGRLGKPVWASARRLSSPATWAWQGWLQDPARSGGAILDLHIHDLDFLTWILGRPTHVMSTGVRTATGALDTALTTLIGHSDGMTSQAEGSLAMPDGFPFTNQLLVVCEKGSVQFDLTAGPSVIVRPSGAPEEYPEIPTVEAGTAEAGGNVSSLGGYFNEIVYFLECIREGVKPTTITPDEAAFAVRLCLAATESAQTGRVATV
ncbi:MAG: Gfo/Idh/MocA family oxidoreductase [Armatimonadetes bacterium]|nr:Gfo/Idh/MocA family oxidoreductase [Armatimonadota bacterium]